jgi:hypothetical protein
MATARLSFAFHTHLIPHSSHNWAVTPSRHSSSCTPSLFLITHTVMHFSHTPPHACISHICTPSLIHTHPHTLLTRPHFSHTCSHLSHTPSLLTYILTYSHSHTPCTFHSHILTSHTSHTHTLTSHTHPHFSHPPSCIFLTHPCYLQPSRVDVSLARTPQLLNSPSGPLNAANGSQNEGSRDIYFPLMTFWPLDLRSN